MGRNYWLIVGGMLSALAAILHILVIAGGPEWYRFFGAGEGMAQAAERGALAPALWTSAIAGILLIWAFYAWSGAGIIRRLPFLRFSLVVISAIYLARAIAPLPILILRPQAVDTFLVVSSLVVLVYGLAYAIGTWTAWPRLRREKAESTA